MIELRGNKIIIDAYANTVCRDSEPLPCPLGTFVEQTTEGMWNNAIREAENIDFLLNHDVNKKLASTGDGTLHLIEDNIGLRVKAEITDENVINKLKKHGVDGFSFGFEALKDRWEDAKDGIKRRFLDKIKLHEVSLLLGKDPAYRGVGVIDMRDNSVLETRNYNLDTKIDIEEDQEKELKLRLLNIEAEL